MTSSESFIRIAEVLDGFKGGLYTEGEVVSIAIGLLAQNLDVKLLQSFPGWLRSKVIEKINSFSYEDEVVTFGHLDADTARNEILVLQEWMGSNFVDLDT